jgi:hypothetical protein
MSRVRGCSCIHPEIFREECSPKGFSVQGYQALEVVMPDAEDAGRFRAANVILGYVG